MELKSQRTLANEMVRKSCFSVIPQFGRYVCDFGSPRLEVINICTFVKCAYGKVARMRPFVPFSTCTRTCTATTSLEVVVVVFGVFVCL